MRIITFDMGGTNIKYGIIEDGKILEKFSMPTDHQKGKEHIKERLLGITSDYIKKYKSVDGIGISIACCVNYETSEVLVAQEVTPEYKDWNFDQLFMENFNLHAVADNDVNTFAAAELGTSAGDKYTNFLVLTIGTGIGGALIFNKKMIRGKNYNAGEVGRIPFEDGTWEQKASITALLEQANAAGLNVQNGKEFFDLVDKKDSTAIKVAEKYYNYVGKGLAGLVVTFNPEAIIIGGGVSAREGLFEIFKEYTNRYLVDGFKDTYDLVKASFLNDGGIIGAYYNFIEHQKLYK